jgi:hypothetical protein
VNDHFEPTLSFAVHQTPYARGPKADRAPLATLSIASSMVLSAITLSRNALVMVPLCS